MREAVSKFGPPVRWYRDLESVPRGCFSFLLAHEFLDALPVHKFVRDREAREWREVLVDLDPDRPGKLR